MRNANGDFLAVQVKMDGERKRRLTIMAAKQQRDLSKMIRWLIDREWEIGGYEKLPIVEEICDQKEG